MLAFWHYARAVFYAYAFQGLPRPPDFYTHAFYSEMRERTVSRLNGLWKADRKPEALALCQAMRTFWTSYWDLMGESVQGTDPTNLLDASNELQLMAWL